MLNKKIISIILMLFVFMVTLLFAYKYIIKTDMGKIIEKNGTRYPEISKEKDIKFISATYDCENKIITYTVEDKNILSVKSKLPTKADTKVKKEFKKLVSTPTITSVNTFVECVR